MKTNPNPKLSSVLEGRYHLHEAVGSGGMARVYLATDLRHGRRVAIKLLAPEVARMLGSQRFDIEIRVTANLSHPNILPLFDSGSAEGLFWYVMPYVEGGSLRDRLGEGGQLPVDEALRIARGIALALDHAHAHGIVHRDIKPENILLREDATYVADFGIALAIAQGDRTTRPGLAIGTPAYMSPEQISQGDHIDGRADVYALGCLTFEMLAGRLPFPEGTPGGFLARISKPPPRVGAYRAGFPPAADNAISRALAPDVDDRFPRAIDFVRALEAAFTGTAPVEQYVLQQQIKYCTAHDGVRIAYATSGAGTPLVKAANWLSHLEFDAASPIWQHWWRALAERHQLIRYDERASGLSDWDVGDISFDAWVQDLEAVVDAAGLDRFALLGVSKGSAISIAYAARHPERVTHLVLHGGFVLGRGVKEMTESMRVRVQLEIDMVRLGWGGRNPAFRQAFTTMFFPGADPDQVTWFNELQRISTSPENAARMLSATRMIDVRELAKQVRCPTLIFHCRDDARVSFAAGELIAQLIPTARFVPLASGNHLPLEHEPAWAEMLTELDKFEREL